MDANNGKVVISKENEINYEGTDVEGNNTKNNSSEKDVTLGAALNGNQTEAKETLSNNKELSSSKEPTLDEKLNKEISDSQNIAAPDNKLIETAESKISLTKSKTLLTPEEQKAIYEKIKSYVEWNSTENLYNSKYVCFCGQKVDVNYVPRTTATQALLEKLRKSFIGCFLEHLNSPQRKDHETYVAKEELTKFIFKQHEDLMQDKNNDVCKDVINVIKKAVEARRIINTELVYFCMWNARLADCMVTQVDSGVKKLKNLEMLSLPANWISDLKGSVLPRTLRFLELFCNLISDVTNLCRGLPSTLCHLGLARNKLSEGSNLHLLLTCQTWNLRTLDLGDNDICDLLYVLRTLTSLNNLVGFTLHGNPCSTCSVYRETTLKYLPNLMYLDNVEFWPMDRVQLTDCVAEDHVQEGSLIFKCFRLMGIPQPTPQTVDKQKVEQTYHIEVELPLLDPELRKTDHILEPTEPEPDIFSSIKEQGNKGEEKAKKKGGNKKKQKGDKKKEKKGKIQENEEDQPLKENDDVAEAKAEVERLSKKRFHYFRTQRMPWSPIIQFPDPALEVSAPELIALRDTLRSKVNVKVVFMKTLPPELKKKVHKTEKKGGKKDKKGKGKKTKEKSGKKQKIDKKEKNKTKKSNRNKENKKDKGKKGKTEDDQNEKKKGKKGKDKKKLLEDEKITNERGEIEVAAMEEQEVKPPQERILQRVTLANFDVQLQQAVWSEKTVDYTWSASEGKRRPLPEAKLAPQPLLGLQYENKDVGKGKKGKGKSKDRNKKSQSLDKRSKSGSRGKKNKDSGPRITSVLPIPNVLTCEMGFGLKRIQDPVSSLPPEEPDLNAKEKSRDEVSPEKVKKSTSKKKRKNI